MAKIAILTTPEGHFSIATAMQETLQNVHETAFLSIRDSIFNLYTPMYQIFPSAYKLPYTMSQNSSVVTGVKQILRRKLMKQVSQFIDTTQPDIIVCTHWLFLPALEYLHQKNHIPIINVITDPRSVHPLLISQVAATNLLFDEQLHQICSKINEKAQYDVTGWYVRKEFYKKTDSSLMQKRLKLHPKQQTVLITGGSEGTMMIVKLVPALLQLKKPLNIIVMCGNNKRLFSSIRSLTRIIKAVSNQSLIIPVGYTDKIAQYMGVADLIIGKAGPNTIFESVATNKPFVAVTHISGQEDGNLDLIKDYKIGFVEENAIKLIRTLHGVLQNPARLHRLQPSISKLAVANQLAAAKLLTIVDKILKK